MWEKRMYRKKAEMKEVGCHYQLGGMMSIDLGTYFKDSDYPQTMDALFKALKDIALTYGYTHIAMNENQGLMGNPTGSSLGKDYKGKCKKVKDHWMGNSDYGLYSIYEVSV